MGFAHRFYLLVLLVLLAYCCGANAAYTETGLGKIILTQGHTTPICRMVLHKENSTGMERWFRIADVPGGHDDVSAVILAALTANRDVSIAYDPVVTTGCGSEPRITYISIR